MESKKPEIKTRQLSVIISVCVMSAIGLAITSVLIFRGQVSEGCFTLLGTIVSDLNTLIKGYFEQRRDFDDTTGEKLKR